VGPEQAPQRIFPPAGLAEHLQEPFLLRRVVVPLRRRDPDLGVESDGAYGLFSRVLDAQLEEEARNGGEGQHLGVRHLEVQIRHGQLPSAVDFLTPGLTADG
jgi:hypothetical protein